MSTRTAYRVYVETTSYENTDPEDVGYYFELDAAERAAAAHAEKENKKAELQRNSDGLLYLGTTLYAMREDGCWHRKNHMSDSQNIIVERIEIQ